MNASEKDLEISLDIAALEEDLENAEKAYLEARKQINIKINELRSKCDHSLVKYVPDASGNNDSFEYCLTCGLEKKRFR